MQACKSTSDRHWSRPRLCRNKCGLGIYSYFLSTQKTSSPTLCVCRQLYCNPGLEPLHRSSLNLNILFRIRRSRFGSCLGTASSFASSILKFCKSFSMAVDAFHPPSRVPNVISGSIVAHRVPGGNWPQSQVHLFLHSTALGCQMGCGSTGQGYIYCRYIDSEQACLAGHRHQLVWPHTIPKIAYSDILCRPSAD